MNQFSYIIRKKFYSYSCGDPFPAAFCSALNEMTGSWARTTHYTVKTTSRRESQQFFPSVWTFSAVTAKRCKPTAEFIDYYSLSVVSQSCGWDLAKGSGPLSTMKNLHQPHARKQANMLLAMPCVPLSPSRTSLVPKAFKHKHGMMLSVYECLISNLIGRQAPSELKCARN